VIIFIANAKRAVIIIFLASRDPIDMNTDTKIGEGIRLRIMKVSNSIVEFNILLDTSQIKYIL